MYLVSCVEGSDLSKGMYTSDGGGGTAVSEVEEAMKVWFLH